MFNTNKREIEKLREEKAQLEHALYAAYNSLDLMVSTGIVDKDSCEKQMRRYGRILTSMNYYPILNKAKV